MSSEDEKKSKPLEAKDIENSIFEAIENKEFDKVREIVLANPKLNLNFVDKDELSPLQHACHIGNVDFTRFLLDNGAHVNYTNRKDGYTPLMFAAIGSKEEVVKLLLERGVDTTVENCVNRTAAQMTAFVGLHRMTGIINSWVSYEDSIEPYTKCRELEDKPRLHSKSLGLSLHKYVVINNNFPIKLFIHLRENPDLLKYGSECIYVLENLSSKASKLGDKIAFRYYWHQYFIGYILELYKKNRKDDKQSCGSEEFDSKLCAKYINTRIRRFLIHQDKLKNPEMDKFAVDCLMKYPYSHLPHFRHILMALGEAKLTGVVSLILQLFEGIRISHYDETCSVCHEPGKHKRCSKCKSVYYCGPVCQNIDWFTHKKTCKSPRESPLSENNDNVENTK